MTTVINMEPVTAIWPNGQMKYGNSTWNIFFEVLLIETARNIMSVKISKKARATRSLLNVLRKRFCMRIMIKIMFPKIPRIAIISLVNRSTQHANVSCSSTTGLSHSQLVTLFVITILACLDQAALVLMFNNEEDHTTERYTVETAYKVAICPRGNLLYMWIYLITYLKVLWKDILGL